MDRRESQLSPRSKRVLAQGRCVASHLGATLYAVAAENDDDNDSWIGEAGLTGADKVVLLSFPTRSEDTPGEEVPGAEAPNSAGLLAAAMMSVCDALHPNLILLDNDRMGAQIAPALANHLAAHLLTGAVVHCTDDGDTVLEQRSPDRRTRRQLSVTSSHAPVVATLSSAAVPTTVGQDDADVIFFKAPRYPVTLPVAPLATDEAVVPLPELDADIVVCAGLGAEDMLAEVRELANVLGAPLVYTKPLCDRLQKGTCEPLCPVVDESAHRIAPTLYVACGAAGTDAHLGAIAGGTQIVSLGREPGCASVLASRYACIGRLKDTLPALTHAARHQPRAEARPTPTAVFSPTPVVASSSTGFAPCPDGVELFSDAEALLLQLQQDELWTP